MKNHVLNKSLIVLAIASGLSMSSVAVQAADSPPVAQMFGVSVHAAKRDEMRAAIKKAGLTPIRVDNDYYCDSYKVTGQIKEASELDVCYYAVKGVDFFATATYTFPSSVDAGQIGRIRDLVASKYGPPTGSKGDGNLGPAAYQWDLGKDTNIYLERGWPDTTTNMTINDMPVRNAFSKLLKEINESKKEKQDKKQSSAF